MPATKLKLHARGVKIVCLQYVGLHVVLLYLIPSSALNLPVQFLYCIVCTSVSSFFTGYFFCYRYYSTSTRLGTVVYLYLYYICLVPGTYLAVAKIQAHTTCTCTRNLYAELLLFVCWCLVGMVGALLLRCLLGCLVGTSNEPLYLLIDAV